MKLGFIKVGLFVAASLVAVSAPASAIISNMTTVTGNTSSGENQPGWMFNRDTSTDTPYQFTNAQAKIGAGSLHVLPISGSSPSDKFIAENFINTPIADVESVSFDYLLGSEMTAPAQFYFNVYANFGVSEDLKYYDCRYDVVATAGSTTTWNTLTFDPTLSYTVAQRGSSPFTCPASPSQMNSFSAGSNIRAFSINLGDTTASDQGMSAYFDNVKVDANGNTTTYNFEMPDTTAPDVTISSPAASSEARGDAVLAATITDDKALMRYYYFVRSSTGMNVVAPVTVNTTASLVNFTRTVDTTGWADGTYTFQMEARDAAGNKDSGSTAKVVFIVNNIVDNKEQCKADGWKTLLTKEKAEFKNQGQCVSYVTSSDKSEHHRGLTILGMRLF